MIIGRENFVYAPLCEVWNRFHFPVQSHHTKQVKEKISIETDSKNFKFISIRINTIAFFMFILINFKFISINMIKY